ncbi:hypothetical protein CEXT_648951 [Caerostris extrusa]|uniref:Uncharacterized protein n=1 Tax=Caerostris extrusa TaxID=172846 RepID=A0AAV4VJP4_CAEEX|nr:hypothetical protein CEXT_648951 [Caerostris extrusa]
MNLHSRNGGLKLGGDGVNPSLSIPLPFTGATRFIAAQPENENPIEQPSAKSKSQLKIRLDARARGNETNSSLFNRKMRTDRTSQCQVKIPTED